MDIHFDAIQDIFSPNLTPVSKGQDKWFCPRCRKSMDARMFFKTKRTDKFPNGLLPECKNCTTLKIDDTEPATFLGLLKEIDVPYIPSEWRKLLAKKSAGGGSILGKYVSSMYMNQHKKYRWEDTKNLVKDEEEMLLSALKNETTSQTEAEQQLTELTSLKGIAPQAPMGAMVTGGQNIAALYGLTPETSKYGLTQEEIDTYRKTWGPDYSEEEYYSMEELFGEMQKVYPSVGIDPIAISNAKAICKMTTKMNKFLDIDDVESATKMSRQLDLFIKSSNLAPQQQKDRSSSTYSISQLAALIEKEGGFIPTYYQDKPEDEIDNMLLEMQRYTERLILGEPQISDLVKNQAELLKKYELPEENIDLDDAFAELEDEMMGGIDDGVPDSEEE